LGYLIFANTEEGVLDVRQETGLVVEVFGVVADPALLSAGRREQGFWFSLGLFRSWGFSMATISLAVKLGLLASILLTVVSICTASAVLVGADRKR
jgi:hypothetical protein